MKKVLFIIIIAAALSFGASKFHFTLTDDGIKILQKVDLAFKNTFVDARGIKRVKLLEPDLVRAGLMDQITKEGIEIDWEKVIEKELNQD